MSILLLPRARVYYNHTLSPISGHNRHLSQQYSILKFALAKNQNLPWIFHLLRRFLPIYQEAKFLSTLTHMSQLNFLNCLTYCEEFSSEKSSISCETSSILGLLFLPLSFLKHSCDLVPRDASSALYCDSHSSCARDLLSTPRDFRVVIPRVQVISFGFTFWLKE